MKITINNIDCYGAWQWDSNVCLVGTYADGSEMDEIWGPDDEYNTWEPVVAELSQWADKHGHVIEELTAC